MDKIAEYRNGNVDITIFDDGTKIMEFDEKNPVIFDFPTSIDIKITNWCDKNCRFCHEKSTVDGKHGDLDALKIVLSELSGSQEFACGGGNPLSHPHLVSFLEWCKEKHFIPSITVNFGHVNRDFYLIKELLDRQLIYGLGISIPSNGIDKCTEKEKYVLKYQHAVMHLIVGIHDPTIINDLHSRFGIRKFLLLGYKEFGRGESYFQNYQNDILNNIEKWKHNIIKIISEDHY
jgi:hypothetical protein